jgi:hypothetical protein
MQSILVRGVNKLFTYFYVNVYLVKLISKLSVLWDITSRTATIRSGAVLQQQLNGTCNWQYVYKKASRFRDIGT